MNSLQTFNYEQHAVRTVMKDGEPWFVLKDVCQVLHLSDTNKTAERLDADELTRTKLVSGGQEREMYIVNEPGLYSVILRSDKPQAKPFRKWVTNEVLPTIRKTGGYVNDEAVFVETYLPNVDPTVKALFSQTLSALRSANAQIAADKPKVLFADAVATAQTSILVGELAKLLRQNGVEIGQNRLFQWMREHGYLIRRKGADYNMPTQRAMELRLFEIKETAINRPDGSVKVSKTPKVTGKGQQYFISLMLGKAG